MSKSSLSAMSKKAMSIVAMAVGAIVLDGESAFAKTVAVGPATCQPTFQHYSTIQAAVNALASVPAANTILVCPGTYPEQITVSQPTLTIKGVASATEALALITIPPAGLAPNIVSASLGLVAAQIGFSNAIGVKVINLTIDGTGGTCGGADRAAGIAFNNIGDVCVFTSAGAVQQVVVRNQTGCAAADGILSDNSFISITGSSVHDVTKNCISQIGGSVNIANNMMNACAIGILMDGTKDATVSGNVVSFSSAYGIQLIGTTECTVNANTIGPYVGTGVYVVNGVNTGVTNNKIKSTYAGLWMTGSLGAIVRLNSIFTSTSFGVGHTGSAGTNTDREQHDQRIEIRYLRVSSRRHRRPGAQHDPEHPVSDDQQSLLTPSFHRSEPECGVPRSAARSIAGHPRPVRLGCPHGTS